MNKMATEKCREICYAVINNIPDFYHSVHLRNYFSQFVESGHFDCFHFRHRPEKQTTEQDDISRKTSTVNVNKSESRKTTCCVIRLKRHNFYELFNLYNGKNWMDKNGDLLSTRCQISMITVSVSKFSKDEKSIQYKTKSEKKNIPVDRVEFTEQDLLQLKELCPPEMMPQGNIGTPTKTFLQYIQDCRLPPKVIQKLGLKFPRTKPKKLFGSVPYDYDGDSITNYEHLEDEKSMNIDKEENFQEIQHLKVTFCDLCNPSVTEKELLPQNHDTSTKLARKTSIKQNISRSSLTMCDDSTDNKPVRVISSTTNNNTDTKICDTIEQHFDLDYKAKRAAKKVEKKRIRELKSERIEEKMIHAKSESEEDDDGCEEWERHEANYDDPSNQARNKERLFEERIELKWEKGGSGLVFYTDAQYWKKFEGDFDEQCADDWDVDMSCYYEENGGDKDSQDLVNMRQEKRRRRGIEATDRYTVGKFRKGMDTASQSKFPGGQIGQFEKHTKGVGRKIMENHGWSDGSKLGNSSSTGLIEALENDGQHPLDKKGFGYYGEKLQRFHPSLRKIPKIEKNEHLITTVYDNPSVTDPDELLLRRNEPYTIKHRPGVSHIEFVKGTGI